MVEDMRGLYQKKLEARLREWKGKIDALDINRTDVNVANRDALNREVREMLQKKEVMKERWKALQGAGNHEWEHRRNELEKASEELKEALDRVAAHFK